MNGFWFLLSYIGFGEYGGYLVVQGFSPPLLRPARVQRTNGGTDGHPTDVLRRGKMESRQFDFLDFEPLPDWFGYWFAGFVDGEGHFAIRKKKRGSFNINLTVKLRDDDIDTLRMIQSVLGVGNIYHISMKPARTGKYGRKINACDNEVWEVNNIAHLWRCIVPLLDRYPLRSKKAKDYLVWREAVALKWRMNGSHFMPQWYIKHMEELERRIKTVRKYKGMADGRK